MCLGILYVRISSVKCTPPQKYPPYGVFFDFTILLMIQRKHIEKRQILSVFERPRFTRGRPIRIYRGGFGLVNLYFFSSGV